MSRPKKQTVDFFPHYCKHGKTIYILEQKYQQKGYCFWFKLLEELGSHNGHTLDFNDKSYCIFFSAKTMISDTEMFDIMNLLAELGAIDQKLWEKRIVWCQNFVDNLNAVYAKRVVSAPEKPISDAEIVVSGVGNPQSKVKESKVKESKVNKELINTAPSNDGGVKEVMDIFYKINPTLNWGNKTIRKACQDLIKKLGLEGAKKLAQYAISVQGEKYAPTITTPYQLWNKLADLKVYHDRQNNNKIQSL